MFAFLRQRGTMLAVLALAFLVPAIASAQPPAAPAIDGDTYVDTTGFVTNFGVGFGTLLAVVIAMLLAFLIVRKIIYKVRMAS